MIQNWEELLKHHMIALLVDLDKLENWVKNLMKFNKGKCKVLKRTLWRNKLKTSYTLGANLLDSSSAEKALGVLVDKLTMYLYSKEGQHHLGLYQEEHCPQLKGSDTSPLVSSALGGPRDAVESPSVEILKI